MKIFLTFGFGASGGTSQVPLRWPSLYGDTKLKENRTKFKINMFTVEQIEQAHKKVKSGADFPKYIQEIKNFGVKGFETWVKDSHTEYFGENNFSTKSKSKYDELDISDNSNKENFIVQLKFHQQGKTDYFTFCIDCAETGIEKWVVRLDEMTCIYYDKKGNEILVEEIPQL